MKAEDKKERVKKLKDWKLWVFSALPTVLLITAVVLAVCGVRRVNDKSYVEFSYLTAVFVLFVVGVLLKFCDGIVNLTKVRSIRNNICIAISVIMTLVFIGVECWGFTKLPEIYERQASCERLLEQYEQANDCGDKEQADVLFDRWLDEFRDMTSVQYRHQTLHSVNSAVFAISILVIGSLKDDGKKKGDADAL